MDLLIARFTLRRQPALDSVINCLVQFVEEEHEGLPPEQEDLVLLSLERLADETSPQRLRDRFTRGEIERTEVVEGLHIRSWTALLAKKMTAVTIARGVDLPEALKKWRTIRETDPLPEIRRL